MISGIDDRSLIAVLVKAVQEILRTVAGYAESFTTRLLNATRVQTDQLCVGSTCITEAQLQELLARENVAAAAGATSNADSDTTSSASTTAPVIEVNGENPAIVQVGSTYSDLGARILGPTADLNLGIHTFVGSTPIEQAVIDTSAPATYHIYYVVTGTSGPTSTSTRTVIVEAPSVAADVTDADSTDSALDLDASTATEAATTTTQ